MKNANLIIIAAAVLGAGYFLTRPKSATAVKSSLPTQTKVTKVNPDNGLSRAIWNVLPSGLVTFNVGALNNSNSQTVDYSRQGYAIGDYAGQTQADAEREAMTSYNDQFLSPFGPSPFQYNG